MKKSLIFGCSLFLTIMIVLFLAVSVSSDDTCDYSTEGTCVADEGCGWREQTGYISRLNEHAGTCNSVCSASSETCVDVGTDANNNLFWDYTTSCVTDSATCSTDLNTDTGQVCGGGNVSEAQWTWCKCEQDYSYCQECSTLGESLCGDTNGCDWTGGSWQYGVRLNEHAGTCNAVCAYTGFDECFSVGTDWLGTNGEFWIDIGLGCINYGGIGCSDSLNHDYNTICAGHETLWTKCLCRNWIPGYCS